MKSPRFSLNAAPSAFSLVEVAMALGVFSFALMSLLGLIPVAVSTHRDAKTDTVLTQIKQRLAAEVILTDGAQLGALNNSTRLFDAEGRELFSPDPSKTVYRGKISLVSFVPPGSSTPSASLQRVELFAVHDPTTDGSILAAARPTGSVLVSRAESAATP